MVYPSEYLDPKTMNFWSLLYVVCTCGLGIPHDPGNNGQWLRSPIVECE